MRIAKGWDRFVFTLATLAAMLLWGHISRAATFTDAQNLEAVADSSGDPAFSSGSLSASSPVLYEGIILNNPGDMLPSAATAPSVVPFYLGGQWQTFVQTVNVNNDGDFGGVALYLAQNYGNIPDTGFDSTQNYTPSQYNSQVARLNSYAQNSVGTLPSAGYQLQAGDLVEVVARGALFFGGKTNINEEHIPTTDYASNPEHSFDVIYLSHPGLPTPTPLSLSTIESPTSLPNFSTTSTLLSNPEHYQGTLVTLQDVRVVPGTEANWQANAGGSSLNNAPGESTLAPVMVEDSTGRQFQIWLGTNSLFNSDLPNGFFNVTGIFDQESPPQGPYNANYVLYVTDPTAITSVPEPSTWVLAAIGILAVTGWRLRRTRA